MSFVNDVEKHLDLTPGQKAEVMRELTSHYEEIKEELRASGTPEAQVEEEAQRRLGSPVDVAARLSAVHNSASWRSAVLAAVPFLGSASYACSLMVFKPHIHSPAILAIPATIMSAVVIREFAKGRRPVWLATWFAGALLLFARIVAVLTAPFDTELSYGPFYARGTSVAFVFFIITFIAAWRTKRWLKPVAIFASIGIVSTACALVLRSGWLVTGIALVAMTISLLASWVYLARCVFEEHPYGDAVQASLFLLASFTLRYSVPERQSYLLVVSEIMIAAAVIWFARAPEKELKITAIWLGTYFWSLGYVTESFSSPFAVIAIVGTIVGALIPTLFLYLIISIPLRTPDKEADWPQIAQ